MNYSDLKFVSCIDAFKFGILPTDGGEIEGKHVTDYQTHEQVFQSKLTDEAKRTASMQLRLLEVSLDVKGGREAALQFIADMVINCTLPEDLRIRAYKPFATTGHAKEIGDTFAISTTSQVLSVLLAGGSVYIGNQRNWKGRKVSPVSVRAYWKVKDGGEDLEPEGHRARFEVTIQGDGFRQVGLDTLTDWQSWIQWRVTNCAKLFRQRMPGTGYSARNGATQDQQGEKAATVRKASREDGKDTRRKKHKTPANTALNEKIRGTLTALQYRLNKPAFGKNSEKNAPKTNAQAKPMKPKRSKA